ncbi:MAG: hypothetical protein OER43_16340 [Gammaproteobacteria bacterium]|nr:hypothetical protein [Gammaproteobacteria bacterium]
MTPYGKAFSAASVKEFVALAKKQPGVVRGLGVTRPKRVLALRQIPAIEGRRVRSARPSRRAR